MKLIVSNGNGLCKCIPLSSGVKKSRFKNLYFILHSCDVFVSSFIEKAVKENKIKQIISAPNKVKWTMYRFYLSCYFHFEIRKPNKRRQTESKTKQTHTERETKISTFISCGICKSIANIYSNWAHSLAACQHNLL